MNSVSKLIQYLGTKFSGIPVYENVVSSNPQLPFIVVRLVNHHAFTTLKGVTGNIVDTYEIFYLSRNPAQTRSLTDTVMAERVSGITGLLWVWQENGQHETTPPMQAEEKGVHFAVKVVKVYTNEGV
jgi:hypothetical protein